MSTAQILIYDGSFNGFLTSVFKAFDQQIQVADIQKNSETQRGLFSETTTVFTEIDKAKLVWKGVSRKSNAAIKNIYFAFLSETKGIEMRLYRYIRKLFSPIDMIHLNFSDDHLTKINHWAKAVAKEKNKMETSIRFQQTQDGICFSNIAPDFDVLPLLTKHFRSYYTNEPWIIYDLKRKYGLFYNLQTVEVIRLDLKEIQANSALENTVFSTDTSNTKRLWNDHFRNTKIKRFIHSKIYNPPASQEYINYLAKNKQAV